MTSGRSNTPLVHGEIACTADDRALARCESCGMWTKWNTHTTVEADPDAVIDTLTYVDAIHEWSPVDFELDDLSERRLHGGTHARVVGRLAGFGVGFDVEVLEANSERLS